jgi:hypothetical protein
VFSPDEAISCKVGDCSPHWRTAQVSGEKQECPRNDMINDSTLINQSRGWIFIHQGFIHFTDEL